MSFHIGVFGQDTPDAEPEEIIQRGFYRFADAKAALSKAVAVLTDKLEQDGTPFNLTTPDVGFAYSVGVNFVDDDGADCTFIFVIQEA